MPVKLMAIPFNVRGPEHEPWDLEQPRRPFSNTAETAMLHRGILNSRDGCSPTQPGRLCSTLRSFDGYGRRGQGHFPGCLADPRNREWTIEVRATGGFRQSRCSPSSNRTGGFDPLRSPLAGPTSRCSISAPVPRFLGFSFPTRCFQPPRETVGRLRSSVARVARGPGRQ